MYVQGHVLFHMAYLVPCVLEHDNEHNLTAQDQRFAAYLVVNGQPCVRYASTLCTYLK